MRFISRSLVWRGPSDGSFFRTSRRKAVHCWTMFSSMNTSTICGEGGEEGEGRGREGREETSRHYC